MTPKNKLGTYLSLGGCTITFGPAFAPVVCGALVTNLGWRSIFLAPILGMTLLGVLGFIYVKDLENSEAHLDAPSVALSGVTLFALSFGLAEIAIDTVLGAVSLIIAVAAVGVFVALSSPANTRLSSFPRCIAFRFGPLRFLPWSPLCQRSR